MVTRMRKLLVMVGLISALVLVCAPVQAQIIPQSNWSLKYVDSQELVGENGAAINAFDNKSGTIWHTKRYQGGKR